jgi:hypothetical protein
MFLKKSGGRSNRPSPQSPKEISVSLPPSSPFEHGWVWLVHPVIAVRNKRKSWARGSQCGVGQFVSHFVVDVFRAIVLVFLNRAVFFAKIKFGGPPAPGPEKRHDQLSEARDLSGSVNRSGPAGRWIVDGSSTSQESRICSWSCAGSRNTTPMPIRSWK